MLDLKPGDRVNLNGYELLASAQHVEEGDREYRLYHNNSSHYLLFSQDTDDVVDRVTSNPRNYGTFIQSWQYSQATEEETANLYRAALSRMVELASTP